MNSLSEAESPKPLSPWLLLACALLPRLLLSAFVLAEHPWGHVFNVRSELALLAQSLVAGDGLGSPFGGSTGPTAFLGPGYPLVIAGLFRLFGTFTLASAAAMLLLHTAFGVATAFVICWLARRTLDVRTANLAALVWSFALPFIWLPAVFWDTSLSALLLIGLLALAFRCAQTSQSKGAWAMLGLVGAVALLVNPSFLLTVLAVFGWAAYQARRSGFSGPLLGFALMLGLFAPWPLRNARSLHAFIPLRSNLGFELWKGNLPSSTGVDDASLYPATNSQEFAAYASEGEVAYMHRKGAEAKAAIAAHPGWFVKLCALRFIRYWTGMGTGNMFAIWHVTLITLLSLLGLGWLVHDRRYAQAMLFALPLLLFPLPYYVTHAELRFQIMVEPVSVVLAAYAMVRLYARLIERRTNSLRTGTGS